MYIAYKLFLMHYYETFGYHQLHVVVPAESSVVSKVFVSLLRRYNQMILLSVLVTANLLLQICLRVLYEVDVLRYRK